MKTPEDEAFDELERRQGGFQAKRTMAADKLQEDQAKYGTSWSKDGERIDPMSVYKEPEQLTEKEKISREMTAEIVAARALAQPAQKPVAWTTMPEAEDWCFVSGNKDPNGKLDGKWFPLYTTPPQRTWVGLTDDEIKDIIGSWGDTPINGYTRKLFDQIEAKLKEKNA